MVRRTGDFLFVTLEKRADGRDCHGFEKRRFLSWLLLGFNVAFVCRRRHGIALDFSVGVFRRGGENSAFGGIRDKRVKSSAEFYCQSACGRFYNERKYGVESQRRSYFVM